MLLLLVRVRHSPKVVKNVLLKQVFKVDRNRIGSHAEGAKTGWLIHCVRDDARLSEVGESQLVFQGLRPVTYHDIRSSIDEDLYARPERRMWPDMRTAQCHGRVERDSRPSTAPSVRFAFVDTGPRRSDTQPSD